MLSPIALKIMSDRGIQSETLARFEVESVERSDGNEWIAFPYFVGNEIVNRKYRTIGGPKKFFQEAEARKVFWNLNSLMDTTLADQPLIICEGEIDALSVIEADYARVLSVPDGAPAQALPVDRPMKLDTYANLKALMDADLDDAIIHASTRDLGVDVSDPPFALPVDHQPISQDTLERACEAFYLPSIWKRMRASSKKAAYWSMRAALDAAHELPKGET